MADEKLKRLVYTIFSDTNMLILALIAIPITIVELFTTLDTLLLIVVDWFIWFAFVMEFAAKIYVEDGLTTYIRGNKADSAISIIIIGSPIAAIATQNLFPFPVLGIARALRIFRVLGYGESIYAKNKKRKFQAA